MLVGFLNLVKTVTERPGTVQDLLVLVVLIQILYEMGGINQCEEAVRLLALGNNRRLTQTEYGQVFSSTHPTVRINC